MPSRQALPVIKNCDDCGVCCIGQEALPVGYYLSPTDDKSILPPELLAELKALAERFNREGWPCNGEPCVWYDAETKRCRHHEYRPDICRDFEVGGEDCRRVRRLRGIDPVTVYRFREGRLVKEEVKRCLQS